VAKRPADSKCCFVEHFGYIQTKKEATGKHSTQRNHTLEEIKVQIIKRVCVNTETLRLVRESKWIQNFISSSKGLNRIINPLQHWYLFLYMLFLIRVFCYP
jgi:hypothetical protein